MGKETGHEHPTLKFLQLFWGVINLAHIDYTQLIWSDMVNQQNQFSKDPKAKIPFARFTKILIAHYMKKDSEIDPRLEDKLHSPAMDKPYTWVRIQGTTLKRKG